jgi:hypothetical protein
MITALILILLAIAVWVVESVPPPMLGSLAH